MASKIRDKGAGTLERRRGHWFVRVSLPDGTRQRYRLCRDVCTCASLSEARRRDMAEAISERERARVQAELDAEERGRTEKRLTVRQFGELWTCGKLYERHGEVKGLKVKASAKLDAYRFDAYVYPLIGNMAVADVTEQDVEHVMAEAPQIALKRQKKPWRQATKFQLYQALRRLFDLAIKPGRLRKNSPVSSDLRPRKDKPKLFGYLYPSELLALLGCKKVPLGRRVAVAVAVYTGLRKGSLRALTWSGVDFQHGTLTSLVSKTDLPQMFEIPTSLVALLQGWYEHLRRPGPDEPIMRDLECRKDREAEALRADLKAAGVNRKVLFSTAENVEPLRFHDARATFVTWALRQGRGIGWITDRTGHLTDEMVRRYARAARTLADLHYEPFPDITDAVPEFAEMPANVRRVNFKRG